MMTPLKRVDIGRLILMVWTAPRLWKWKPARHEYFSGKMRYWSWLCFSVGWDGR